MGGNPVPWSLQNHIEAACPGQTRFCFALVSHTGQLTPQKFTFSQLWQLDVQDQGVSAAGEVGRGLVVRALSLPADSLPRPLLWASPERDRALSPSLCKATYTTGLGTQPL